MSSQAFLTNGCLPHVVHSHMSPYMPPAHSTSCHHGALIWWCDHRGWQILQTYGTGQLEYIVLSKLVMDTSVYYMIWIDMLCRICIKDTYTYYYIIHIVYIIYIYIDIHCTYMHLLLLYPQICGKQVKVRPPEGGSVLILFIFVTMPWYHSVLQRFVIHKSLGVPKSHRTIWRDSPIIGFIPKSKTLKSLHKKSSRAKQHKAIVMYTLGTSRDFWITSIWPTYFFGLQSETGLKSRPIFTTPISGTDLHQCHASFSAYPNLTAMDIRYLLFAS